MKFQTVSFYSLLLQLQASSANAFFPFTSNAASLAPRAREAPLNATGRVKVNGYDVSKPYPGVPDTSGDWNVGLQIRDVALSSEPGKAEIDPRLTFFGPEYLVKGKMDPSWTICQVVLQGLQLKNDTGKPIDPTCKGVLSDKCLQQLDRKAKGDFQCRSSLTSPNDDDDPCGDIGGFGSRKAITYRDLTNQTAVRRFGGVAPNFAHNATNYTDYDNAVDQIYVIVTSWHANQSVVGGFVDNSNALNVSFSCLAADAVEKGSRALDAAAGRVGRSAALLTVMALAVLTFNLLL